MDVGAQFLSFKLEALLHIFNRMLFVFDGPNSNEIKQVLKFLNIESKVSVQTIRSGSFYFCTNKDLKNLSRCCEFSVHCSMVNQGKLLYKDFQVYSNNELWNVLNVYSETI